MIRTLRGSRSSMTRPTPRPPPFHSMSWQFSDGDFLGLNALWGPLQGVLRRLSFVTVSSAKASVHWETLECAGCHHRRHLVNDRPLRRPGSLKLPGRLCYLTGTCR